MLFKLNIKYPGFSAGAGTVIESELKLCHCTVIVVSSYRAGNIDMYDVKWRDTNASGEGASGV